GNVRYFAHDFLLQIALRVEGDNTLQMQDGPKPRIDANIKSQLVGWLKRGRADARYKLARSKCPGTRVPCVRCTPRPDFPAHAAPLGNSQVVVVLQVEPELCWQAKILSQADGSLGADGTISAHDFVDSWKVQCL